MLKKNNGITLIALVITIIVLLILAGISISAITGDDGIATRAKGAKEETRAGEVQEIIDLWKMDVSAKKLDPNWGNVKTENELLEEMLDSGKVKESEINRTNKTITIASRVISYSIEVYNPYEIRAYNTNNLITLYNKDTEEYEDLGERVIVESSGTGEILFDGDASEYIEPYSGADLYDYPEDTITLFMGKMDLGGNLKITIYKNGTITTWEGYVDISPR